MSSPTHVLSIDNIRMLKSEISRCVESCNHRVIWPGFVPSRLLFVGADGDDGDSVRLMTRGDIISKTSWAVPTAQVKYAALSYCWGSSGDAEKQCKTELHSFQERLHAIPFTELTPVVRDAAIVARRLCIPYLWVDSLCIIQDDKNDWANECSLMGLVYSNAYITISTLSSSSCQDGFLHRPSPSPTADEIVSGWYDDDALDSEMAETNDMIEDYASSSWSTRGWTFQEEKLSTRLVYFGTSRVHFCCSNWIYSEGNSTRSEVYERSIMDLGRDDPIPNRHQALVTFWKESLVPQFSARLFTVARDKLPAIAGVAKYIGDVTGDEYVAGLWKSSLVSELMWCCNALPCRFTALLAALSPDAAQYTAPSWSWARFPAAANMDFYFGEAQTRGLALEAGIDVAVTQVGPNVYGEILCAELAVTTKVWLASREHCRFYLGDNYRRVGNWRNWSSISCILDWSSEDEWEASQRIELALVGSYFCAGKTQKRWYGILVYPCPTVGKYYRVGIFDGPPLETGTEMREIIIM